MQQDWECKKKQSEMFEANHTDMMKEAELTKPDLQSERKELERQKKEWAQSQLEVQKIRHKMLDAQPERLKVELLQQHFVKEKRLVKLQQDTSDPQLERLKNWHAKDQMLMGKIEKVGEDSIQFMAQAFRVGKWKL